MNSERDSHPTYGVVEINRVQSSGCRLVGSSVEHNQYMMLRVSRADRHTSDYDSDKFYARERIIEVALSPAQIYGLLCNFNAGGTPCTIRNITGERPAGQPPCSSDVSQMKLALDNQDSRLTDSVEELSDEAESILSSKMLVGDKKRLASKLRAIVRLLKDDAPFLHECNKERLEKMVAVARLEAEAGIAASAQEIGLDVMSGKVKLVDLPRN